MNPMRFGQAPQQTGVHQQHSRSEKAAHPLAAEADLVFNLLLAVVLLPVRGSEPSCANSCTKLIDGADLDDKGHDYMCLKQEYFNGVLHNVCRPMWTGTQCPADMDRCYTASAPEGGGNEGGGNEGGNEGGVEGCEDTAGKWARRKCAKKLTKGRCHKRKTMRNCKATCNLC